MFEPIELEKVQNIVCEAFTGTLASIAANSQGVLTVSGISKSGYTPLVAIFGGQGASSKLLPQTVAVAVSSGSASFYVANVGSTASTSVTCTIRVIFVKK